MEIDIKKITNGDMNGQYVWICDYRPSKTGIHAKPVRHVKPQKVLVVDTDEVRKKIYYSQSCFLGLNKKGEPLKSKAIVVFDSTGYRTYTGIPVCVFDNEKECNKKYMEFEKVFNPVTERRYLFNEITNAGLSIIENDGNLMNEKMLIEKLNK